MKRLSLAVLLSAGLLAVGGLASGPAAADEPAAIPLGVTIGGLDVGGLTTDAATAAVQQAFQAPLVLHLGTTEISVTPDVLGAVPVIDKAVERALVAAPGSAVSLGVTVNGGTADFVAKTTPAKVTRGDFGAVIVIHRAANRLDLFNGMRYWREFGVATGQTTYPTPLGHFQIVVKWRDPWWYPPASPWAKGQKPIPPGPGNPLGTRWMGLSAPGVGIHGTPQSSSIGYSVSHGCIRMLIPQAEWLFEQVDVGTPVYIVAS